MAAMLMYPQLNPVALQIGPVAIHWYGLTYLAAYGNLPDHPEAQGLIKTGMEQGTIRFKTPPTPDQLAAARQAAQDIVARARANATPR